MPRSENNNNNNKSVSTVQAKFCLQKKDDGGLAKYEKKHSIHPNKAKRPTKKLFEKFNKSNVIRSALCHANVASTYTSDKYNVVLFCCCIMNTVNAKCPRVSARAGAFIVIDVPCSRVLYGFSPIIFDAHCNTSIYAIRVFYLVLVLCS